MTPIRLRRRADFLVGLDVRVPDALAGDARAGRKPARADQPADRVAAEDLRQRSCGLPWGISESAYNARDLEFTYQYSSFGVPGLGLKRGLGEKPVIAPYATALAAMVDPHAAVLNFARLAAIAAAGPYGFYEALDYTPSRLPGPDGGDRARVHGASSGHDDRLDRQHAAQRRDAERAFIASRAIQATELLLQERTPRDVAVAHVERRNHDCRQRPRLALAECPRRSTRRTMLRRARTCCRTDAMPSC